MLRARVTPTFVGWLRLAVAYLSARHRRRKPAGGLQPPRPPAWRSWSGHLPPRPPSMASWSIPPAVLLPPRLATPKGRTLGGHVCILQVHHHLAHIAVVAAPPLPAGLKRLQTDASRHQDDLFLHSTLCTANPVDHSYHHGQAPTSVSPRGNDC